MMYKVVAIKGSDEFTRGETSNRNEAIRIARDEWIGMSDWDQKSGTIEVRAHRAITEFRVTAVWSGGETVDNDIVSVKGLDAEEIRKAIRAEIEAAKDWWSDKEEEPTIEISTFIDGSTCYPDGITVGAITEDDLDEMEFLDTDYDTTDWSTWYAVLEDDEDGDWGYGSFDLDEAKDMVKAYPNGYVAVIDIRTADCVDEIRG